jgi:hypothetical protein
MTYAIQELVIRDVAPIDTAEITALVAAAMARVCLPVGGPATRSTPALDDVEGAYAVTPK